MKTWTNAQCVVFEALTNPSGGWQRCRTPKTRRCLRGTWASRTRCGKGAQISASDHCQLLMKHSTASLSCLLSGSQDRKKRKTEKHGELHREGIRSTKRRQHKRAGGGNGVQGRPRRAAAEAMAPTSQETWFLCCAPAVAPSHPTLLGSAPRRAPRLLPISSLLATKGSDGEQPTGTPDGPTHPPGGPQVEDTKPSHEEDGIDKAHQLVVLLLPASSFLCFFSVLCLESGCKLIECWGSSFLQLWWVSPTPPRWGQMWVQAAVCLCALRDVGWGRLQWAWAISCEMSESWQVFHTHMDLTRKWRGKSKTLHHGEGVIFFSLFFTSRKNRLFLRVWLMLFDLWHCCCCSTSRCLVCSIGKIK